MRVLFSFTGGGGHALPMMPVARALSRRGHQILFTCQAGMVETIRRTGFDAVDSGGPTLAAASERRRLVAVDRAAEVGVMRDAFAGRIAGQRAPRIVEVAADFAPDVVVRDEVDFGAAAAAERLGVPHASVVVLAAGGMISPGLLDEPLSRLCTDLGLPPDPELFDRFLTLVPVMPSFRDPEAPLPLSSLAIRPDILEESATPDPGSEPVDAWLAGRPDRPLIYFTLGTIFHQESGDLFPRVLTGLESLDANVVVTVGNELDPAELGARRDNVLVERFIPQRALLPRAAVVVSHAGSGTVVSALACGVPVVLLPLGADQPWNADRCAALGVGRVLDAVAVSSTEAAAAVTDLLATPDYRAAATALQTEAASLPTAEAGADAVELLVSERRILRRPQG